MYFHIYALKCQLSADLLLLTELAESFLHEKGKTDNENNYH